MTGSMRAMRCEALATSIGGLKEVLVPTPEPGPGEVLVRLRAASINFPDLLMLQGKYQFRPPLPFVPGLEGAGEIDATGERVMVSARFGTYAEAIAVPRESARPMPRNFDFAEAAAFGAGFLTAYVALVRRAEAAAGETVLIHGASGGVGLAAVELAKHLGCHVIATGGSDDKLAIVKSKGADHVLNISSGRFRDTVKELTGGRGADVIYDPVGGDVFDESAHCIAWGGRILVVGFASGRIPSIDVNWPLIKGYSIIGVRAGEFGRRDPEKGRENLDALSRLAEAGVLRPHIHARLPLAQANEAHSLLSRREVVGKIVLEM